MSEIKQIPLQKILPNPDQPRKIIDQSKINILADSMKEVGQKTTAKVRPLTPEESAKYPGSEYLMLGGHRRLEAAIRVGLETLRCEVLEANPEEDDLTGFVDNESEEMHWLDKDLALERLYLKHKAKNGTQQTLAAQLGVTQARVSYAITIAEALSTASKALIYNAVIKSSDNWEITERPILALAALKDPEKVDQALPVVLDRQMTAPQVKALVAHIQAGGDPAQFELAPKKKKGEVKKNPESNTGALVNSQNEKLSVADGGLKANGKKPMAAVQRVDQALEGLSQGLQTLKQSRPGIKNPFLGFLLNLGDKFKQVGVGFKDAGLKSLLGKLPKNPWEALGVVFWKAPIRFFKFLWQLAKKVFGFIWHRVLQPAHRYCKELANKVIPLRGSGTSQKTGNPIQYLGHYAVFGFFLAVYYLVSLWLIGQLIPPLRYWINTGVAYLAHLILQTALWGLGHALNTPWMAIGLGVILLVWIKKAFQPKFLEMLAIAALLVAAWWFRGWWMQYLPTANNFISPPNTSARNRSVDDQDTKNDQVSSGVTLPTANRELPTAVSAPKITEAPARSNPAMKKDAESIPASGAAHTNNTDLMLVKSFIGYFLEFSYTDTQTPLSYFKLAVSPGYLGDFMGKYFPPSFVQQIQDKKLKQHFTYSQPAQLEKGEGGGSVYLVRGSIMVESDLHSQGEELGSEPANYRVTVSHGPSGQMAVTKVEKVTISN